jgi:hypothetical protein
MSNRKRLHRADPARTGPERDFSKLYHGIESINGRNAASRAVHSDAPHSGVDNGPRAEGIELAYSVIDKYIAEGRKAAEGFSNQSYTTRVASDNLQNILERMLHFQAEILPLWIEMLATLVRFDPSRNGSAAAPDIWSLFNSAANRETMAASIEVVSFRPVQVSIALQPNSEAQCLIALGLNAVDSKKPALTDIRFVTDEIRGGMKLRICVPEGQPSGIYSGVIVNRDTGETRGTLSIRIAD